MYILRPRMIERVCDQHQLIKHFLYFILKKIVCLKRTFRLEVQLHLCKSSKSEEYEYPRGFIFIIVFICHVQPLVAHELTIYLFI